MADPSRIVVLVNGQARHVAADPGLPDRLRRAVGELGSVVVTGRPDEVEGALHGAGPLDDAIVAICGGDGTGMVALTALTSLQGASSRGRATLPPIALLPAGTVNTIARSLGIRRRPERRLVEIVARLRAGRPPPIHVHATISANDRVGFIFGAGLVSTFFALYDGSAHAGRIWAALQIGRIFVGSFVGSPFATRIMAPVPAKISVDGQPHPLDRVTLFLASTLTSVGLGLEVTYRANEAFANEAFDAFHVVATDLPAARLGPQLPRVLAGRPLRAEHLLDALAREVQLELPPGASTLLDGELFPEHSVTLRAGPRVGFVC
jgi:diacylglycerol kinase (ATP)